MSKDNKNRLAAAAAIGAVAGVITGILFAPKSGKETRDDLKKSAVDAKNKVISESKKAQDELNRLLDSAKVKGSDLSEYSKKKVDAAKKAKNDLVKKMSSEDSEVNEKELEKALKKAEDAEEALRKALKK